MPLSGRVPMVCASPMLLVHWYSRRVAISGVIAYSTPPAKTGETPVSWSLKDAPPGTLALVSAPYHTTQTSVDVQIVSDWVTQFSGQLNALSFVCAVDVVAFVRHTT